MAKKHHKKSRVFSYNLQKIAAIALGKPSIKVSARMDDSVRPQPEPSYHSTPVISAYEKPYEIIFAKNPVDAIERVELFSMHQSFLTGHNPFRDSFRLIERQLIEVETETMMKISFHEVRLALETALQRINSELNYFDHVSNATTGRGEKRAEPELSC